MPYRGPYRIARSILLLALTSLFAVGCATHQKAPGTTFDRIGQEMQGAVDAKTKGGADAALKLDCGAGLGAATHITGAFAFAAAGKALELLLKPDKPA